MLPFDMPVLYALEKLRTPFLDAVMGAVTYLGHEMLFMVVAIAVYWCFSKKWGYYLLCVGFLGTLANQMAKIACKVPRPWVRDPGFTIVENARAAATGYSFPSGHTNSIVAVGGCIALSVKKTWVRVVCVVLIVLVSFSRLYLGVHYPSDVLFSLVLNVILVFAFYPLFARCDEKPAIVYVFVAALSVVSLAYAFFLEAHAFPADTDPENLASAVKNAWSFAGAGFGMLLGLWIDAKYIRFDVKAPWWAQLLKIAVGLGLLLGIKAGLKPLCAAVFGSAQFTNAIRYFIVVLFAAAVWPLTFRWFAAGCRKIPKETT